MHAHASHLSLHPEHEQLSPPLSLGDNILQHNSKQTSFLSSLTFQKAARLIRSPAAASPNLRFNAATPRPRQPAGRLFVPQ